MTLRFYDMQFDLLDQLPVILIVVYRRLRSNYFAYLTDFYIAYYLFHTIYISLFSKLLQRWLEYSCINFINIVS